MLAHFLLENLDQGGVHEFKVVGDEKADARFCREFFRKFLLQPFLVPFLHDDDDIRPAELPGGDLDARGVFRAGGADIPSGFAFEKVFRR